MRTLTGGVVLLACFGLATIWLTQPGASPAGSVPNLAQQEQIAIRYEIDRARRDAFAAFTEEIYSQLEHGTIPLAEASRRILAYAETFHPSYLDQLQSVEAGATLEEKVARNVLRYFHSPALNSPQQFDPILVARLDRELQTFVNAQQQPIATPAGSGAEPRYSFQ